MHSGYRPWPRTIWVCSRLLNTKPSSGRSRKGPVTRLGAPKLASKASSKPDAAVLALSLRDIAAAAGVCGEKAFAPARKCWLGTRR